MFWFAMSAPCFSSVSTIDFAVFKATKCAWKMGANPYISGLIIQTVGKRPNKSCLILDSSSHLYLWRPLALHFAIGSYGQDALLG